MRSSPRRGVCSAEWCTRLSRCPAHETRCFVSASLPRVDRALRKRAERTRPDGLSGGIGLCCKQLIWGLTSFHPVRYDLYPRNVARSWPATTMEDSRLHKKPHVVAGSRVASHNLFVVVDRGERIERRISPTVPQDQFPLSLGEAGDVRIVRIQHRHPALRVLDQRSLVATVIPVRIAEHEIFRALGDEHRL